MMPRTALIPAPVAPAAADSAELLAILARIADDLHALRVAAERPRGGALTQADRAALEILLPAISAAVGNFAFTARELLEHAATADPELQAQIVRALGPLNGNTARRLGRLLLRADGFGLTGRRIARAGDCRDGALWTCEQV